jgi:hypothetical protein
MYCKIGGGYVRKVENQKNMKELNCRSKYIVENSGWLYTGILICGNRLNNGKYREV